MRNAPPRATLLLALLLAGCAAAPVNPSLDRIDPRTGYRFSTLELGPHNTDEIFFITSMSGGGMRAAALDYGVLQELAGVRLPGGGSLLDELDLLSSASMASVVAAYYGLYGQQAFLDRFDDEVLQARMQSAYKRKLLAPWQWPRLWSPRFGRSELAQAWLERHLFHGATFADMPRRRPLILLGATDMTIGESFSFTQGTFDRLCSSLDEVTVARAVTASMAFTGAFTPVAFRNYPKEQCGYVTPAIVDEYLSRGPLDDVRSFDRARGLKSYEDEQRRWIHTLDGGVADNIGARVVKQALMVRDVPWSIADRIEAGAIRKLVVLIVDARAAVPLGRDRKRRAPKLAASVIQSASAPLAARSSDTVELVREHLDDLADARDRHVAGSRACAELGLESSRCRELFGLDDASEPPDVEVYFIHARLELVEDPEMRDELLGLPTTLQLPGETVGKLIDAAGPILRASPDYGRLLTDLGAETGP